MEAIRPWCISRQLWWGHRIPVWYCSDEHMTVTETEPEACAECGSRDLRQDDDVLDTWFSSALWPFATLGWPDATPELRAWYPDDVNSTDREIIFLWEARMIMAGLELMGDIPFHDVNIHSTVLRPRRTSHVEEPRHRDRPDRGDRRVRRGRDAVRAAQDLVHPGRALLLRRDRGGPQAREQALERRAADPPERRGAATPEARPRDLEERWILARIERRPSRARGRAGRRFEFAASTDVLYHLTFDDFCDWYAEAIKPRLYEDDEDAVATALAALERLLALLHPVMPHVTEEIWSQLPGRETRLIVSAWPEPDGRFADHLEALDRVQEAAQIFRRSGVEVELGSDDQRRIFAAVVRPERSRVDGNSDAEVERLRKRGRPRGGHARERALRRERARRRRRRRSARSSSATDASSPPSAARRGLAARTILS